MTDANRVGAAPALRRTLGFWQVTASGVGIVIGAGIYVLIGSATREAGAGVWMAFAAAGLLSALSALSYAELAGMFPSAGAEYEFAKKAFNEFIGFVTYLVHVTEASDVIVMATLVVSSKRRGGA